MQEVGNATNPNLARCTFWYSGHYDDDCDGGDDGGGHYDDDDDCDGGGDGGHYDDLRLQPKPSQIPQPPLMLVWTIKEEYVDAVLAYDDSA